MEEKPSEEGREKREVKLCLCANWCVGVLPVGSDTGYGSVICKRLLFCWKQKYVVTSDRSSREAIHEGTQSGEPGCWTSIKLWNRRNTLKLEKFARQFNKDPHTPT